MVPLTRLAVAVAPLLAMAIPDRVPFWFRRGEAKAPDPPPGRSETPTAGTGMISSGVARAIMGGVRVTTGCVYPEPGLFTVMPVTTPLVMMAVAVAPVPVAPSRSWMVTKGAEL